MDAIHSFRLVGEAAEMLKQRYSDCIEISRLEKETEATGKILVVRRPGKSVYCL